jgi:hypothetical protein
MDRVGSRGANDDYGLTRSVGTYVPTWPGWAHGWRDEPLGCRYTDGWIDGRACTGSRDSGDDLRKRSSFHISLLSSKVVVTHQATLSSTLSLSVEVHSVALAYTFVYVVRLVRESTMALLSLIVITVAVLLSCKLVNCWR